MPVYIYVQAKVSEPVEDPGSISFQHVLVEAADENEAYSKGQNSTDGSFFVRDKTGRETINDYVIRLDTEINGLSVSTRGHERHVDE